MVVNLTQKNEPDKDFSFTVPKEEIQTLKEKEIGKHTIHVYANDGQLTSQEVKDVTTGDFEVTAIPNVAPVIDKLTDTDGKNLATVTEGIDVDYGMKLTWHDDDGDAVTGHYIINQSSTGTEVANGNINELANNGTSNTSGFNIAGTDMAKLKANEVYTVTAKVTDGKAESNSSSIYTFMVKERPNLELPEQLSFKEIAVDSTRQLDLRDAGWDQIKKNGNTKVTVQQTTPWVADGVVKKLSPVEMVSSADEYNNHRGTPIDDKAVEVKFKADGTLDWTDQSGLFQPIGTDSLAGNYSTELTWTVTDASE